MSEMSSKEADPATRRGFSRFLRGGFTREEERMYDIYTNLYPDVLKGDSAPGHYEQRLDYLEARANRSLGRKVLARFVGWVKADEPNLTTGETNLILDEGQFKEGILDSSDPGAVATRLELERVAASSEPIAELRQIFGHLSLTNSN
jgi:hypothetical protein